jgi:hypothetical protein
MTGRIFNPFCTEAIAFESLMQFLLQMDGLFNKMKFPQTFSATREFAPVGEPESAAAPAAGRQYGAAATFALRVLFRQNSSWQGSVQWLEGDREESFQSVLELVFLLDSVLSGRT